MREGREYLFSVVMAVHDTRDYVQEAIDSVIGQTVGFAEHVQLVLVDDGSTDGSGEVCERCAERFPDNVVCVRQDNAGVSAARNEGLRHARGAYVNFLDSDDKWGLGAFAAARDFLARHDDVDVVAFPTHYFEAKEGVHTLSRNRTRTCVVDLDETPEVVQLSTRDCFMRASAIEGLRFDERLHYAEDMLFVNTLLLRERRLGICVDDVYWYRKRAARDSALNDSVRSPEFYLTTPREVHRALFEFSERMHGQVKDNVQFAVMHDLQFRLMRGDNGTLDAEGLATYREHVTWLLSRIHKNVLAKQRSLTTRHKIYAFALKYGVSVESVCRGVYVKRDAVRSRFEVGQAPEHVYIKSLPGLSKSVHVKTIERTAHGVALTGTVGTLAFDCPVDVRLTLGAVRVTAERLPANVSGAATPFDGDILPQLGFRAELPYDGREAQTLRASLVVAGQELPAQLVFGYCAGLTHLAENSWCELGDVLARRDPDAGADAVVLEPGGARRAGACERRLCEELAARPETQHLVAWRTAAKRLRRKKGRKRLWLIKDHVTRAGDNGEALFRYLHDHPVRGVTPVFSVAASSPDHERLRGYGRVVAAGTDEEKEALLQADVFLCSYAYGVDVNPFGADRPYLSDLLRHRLVFLQHGVTKDDVSKALNKGVRNTALFVCAAPRERRSILEGDYGYAPDEVVLTGFPRHDALLAEAAGRAPSRRLYLMPTWRKQLACAIDPATGERPPMPGFEDSDFYRFWQGLVESPRLNDLLARHGWEARLVLHPNLSQEAPRFHGTDRVQVMASCSYHEAFLDASCLVTDYSSVFFDFGLLKRAIVYAQPDRAAFFKNHSYTQGYFSYDRDGFGPVCASLDEVVCAVEAAIEREGAMEDVYARRVDDFFFWPDKPRCQLVVEAVCRLTS